MKRTPCEHCARKFVDEAALARHVRAVHKKSAKLVAELRAEIKRLTPVEYGDTDQSLERV